MECSGAERGSTRVGYRFGMGSLQKEKGKSKKEKARIKMKKYKTTRKERSGRVERGRNWVRFFGGGGGWVDVSGWQA